MICFNLVIQSRAPFCSTNLPKEIMRFEDLPFETGESASFVSHQQVRAYLERYAEPVRHLIRVSCQMWLCAVHFFSKLQYLSAKGWLTRQFIMCQHFGARVQYC